MPKQDGSKFKYANTPVSLDNLANFGVAVLKKSAYDDSAPNGESLKLEYKRYLCQGPSNPV